MSSCSARTQFENRSRTSSSSTVTSGLRVQVVLFQTKRLAIPVDSSTSFEDLEAEAIRRAARLKINVPDGEYEFRLDSEDGPLAFPTDLLIEVLPTASTDGIFVRWITAGRAVSYRRFEDIPEDTRPISPGTSIRELKSLAIQRVYTHEASVEIELTPGFKVELFLTACALRNTDEDNTTLGDFGCTGTRSNPLNIFIVPITDQFADADAPQHLWPFKTSERGTAAFLTCLKAFMAKSRSKSSTHRRLLRTVFEITHFPPALEALHVLNELNRLEPREVAILATCFNELALRMIPRAYINNDLKQGLQGSRQIFAWVESEFEKAESEADDPESPIVRAITLEELDRNPDSLPREPGKRIQILHIDAAGDAEESSASDHPRCTRFVKARTDEAYHGNVHTIALALWGQYSAIENFHIDFQGNFDNPVIHNRTPRPGHRDFQSLLKMANESSCFKMVPPKRLYSKLANCITLSEDGYVSRFGMSTGDLKSTERKTCLWNVISGVTILDAAPGDEIHTALQLIIPGRKADGTWHLDDWESVKIEEGEDASTPQEAIVICFDVSWSMDEPMGYTWTGAPNDLTKLSEMKQIFSNVINRMLGYQLIRNFVGVVTFSNANRIRTKHELSRVNKQEFHDMVGDLHTEGQTAIWDALMKAKDMLVAFKNEHPETKLRIIALTDGEDNQSNHQPADVCQSLYDSDIVLDSIVIGSDTRYTKDLFKMSKHTGGYAFHPSSRSLLFQIFLLEPFLDISIRPDIVKVPITNYQTSVPKTKDMMTIYDFPSCRRHPLEAGSFLDMRQATPFFASRSSPLIRSASGMTSSLAQDRAPNRPGVRQFFNRPLSMGAASILSDSSGASSGRICLCEITQMANNLPSDMDIYVSESDMSFWKVVLAGPQDTPYAAGAFILTVQINQFFPQLPPTVRFVTPILHPNITKHGRICHQIFTKGWKTSYHVSNVLDEMRNLLLEPMMNDAVDELASFKFWSDKETADEEIRRYVNHFALRPRSELRTEIMSTQGSQTRVVAHT
ncbi:hypothetical protein Egran_03610 [Elaphomyces granulatus]|uniref:UBC core domain-containing protein n=1 Tax=Elaphomyces granulatus TaxID=519963 RepID=A0A232LXT7_9EURO|nr:hypothetical protein Egran_03610 [Elaphomyces granulatus]